MAIFFNGQMLISPTTASAVNDSAMVNQSTPVGNTVAILGSSVGGKPNTPLYFGNPRDAQSDLVSGPLLDAVLAAFDPSAETGGPNQVVAIRVNPATQATGVMKDASNNSVINLSSTDYGLRQNQVQWRVETGSLTGLRVTVRLGQDVYTQDNIARNAFTVQYTGAGASATISATNTAVTLAVAGSTVSTIDLTTYKTVGDLVGIINTVSGFTAQVIGQSFTSPALNGLDTISAVNVKTAAATVTANLQAVIDWLNGSLEGLVTATRVTGAGTVPAVTAWTSLSGASDGTITNNEWANAFGVLQTVDAQWVCVASANAAVYAMADTHVQYMSTVGRKERRAIVGMDLNTTDEAAITQAQALNSDRTSLVHIGHYNINQASGELTLYPAYITAAMIAGAFAAVSPGTPLTNKTINVSGLERYLRNPTDTDRLITGGVLCTEKTPNGYKVVQSISTWLVNTKFNRREQSCGAALDYAVRAVREALDPLRGSKNDPITMSRAITIATTTLNALAIPEPQGPGVLVGDKNSPAFKNVTASVTGDALSVSFQCSPVIPANYITVTVYAVPYSGTASA